MNTATGAAAIEAPGGFKPLAIGGDFMAVNGPLYVRVIDARVQVGFRVLQRHTNPLNICHGGMLASFADMLLPVCIHRQSEVG
jgi:acyl-coenzyme A thioesterase PaaI-like protein